MMAISLTPDLTEVTMFGGSPRYIPSQQDSKVQRVAATTIMMFGELNQCAHCVYREGEICT